jgi:hypothetical protein
VAVVFVEVRAVTVTLKLVPAVAEDGALTE